jgi:hypothetical protein
MTTPDILRFTQRAPRQRSEAPRDAALAYVEIPLPNPDTAVSIVDVAVGTLEDARPRAVEIVYESENANVSVRRNADSSQALLLTGATPSPIGVLNGLRWDMPCDSGGHCVDPPVVTAGIAGPTGDSYQVTLRFRGVIETRDYPGSYYNDGNYWSEGVDPEDPSVGLNIYRLDISDPPQVYYLNTSMPSHIEGGTVYAVDYTKTVTMNANSAISMTAKGEDGLEGADDSVQIPGLTYAHGQFLQMNVLSVVSANGVPLPVSPDISQEAVCSPIRAVKVEEDPAGCWTPVVSRGTFYRVWRMNASEGNGSWLRDAGYMEGQYLLLTYTTELDWRRQSGAGLWTGTGGAGGGGLWKPTRPAPLSSSSRAVSLVPTGGPGAVSSPRLLALGGLRTSNGVELLTEAGRFNSGTLLPAGQDSVNNVTAHIWVECFPATTQTVTGGRARGTQPLGQGIINDWDSQTHSVSALLSYLNVSADPSSVVFRFSGAVYVQTEGFYDLTVAHGGKMRLFHWGLPVVDKWYGQALTSSRTDNYAPYLHTGWHDYVIEWAPDTTGDSIHLTHTGSLWWCSGLTGRSQVQTINTQTGTLTLKQSYVAGGDTSAVPVLTASYALEGAGLPVRGYANDAGGYVSLDLNPSAGRVCSMDDGSSSPPEIATKDWALHSSCWLYAIPSMACALTDQNGVPYSQGYRDWLSCVSHGLTGTIRWGRVSNQDALQSGVSTDSPLGASSSFGGAILGQSVYSSSTQSTGVSDEYDPRGDYASAVVFAHLNVVSGTPSLESLRIYDVRSRGGGLSHETSPQALPTGGPQERTETNWDLSPWDGYDGPVSGTAVYEIPQSVLDGTDGGPIFTAEEVEALVRSTVPLGISPIVTYIP